MTHDRNRTKPNKSCRHRQKKHLYAFLAALFFCVLFSGCGKKETDSGEQTSALTSSAESADNAVESSRTAATDASGNPVLEVRSEKDIEVFSEKDTEPEAETTVPEETAPVDDETPPEEGMVRSPLTNLWTTKELAETRPIAVMYPTDKKAQPQYGLGQAEIFYEIMEEGSMSRQMAIMTDWSGLSRIGNIRSTRDYFITASMEWDSILVHFGGPEVFVKELLTRADVDNINGVGGVMGSDYGAFYRIPAGSRSEHTAYTDSVYLAQAIKKAGFKTAFRTGYWKENRWLFSPASKPVDLTSRPGCADAVDIDMSGCFPVTKSAFRYNAEDGLYYRSIYGEPQRDALTGNQLAFTNILVESCTWGERGLGYLSFNVVDQGRSGYYITGGKIIPCTWSKPGEYEVTRFYDLNGKEIILNTGKTMICIGRDCDGFSADGVRYDL